MLINYWPTDYTVITNRFGADPAYYRQFNLPGHEGIDVRTHYLNYTSPIYSCSEGVIGFVGTRHAQDPYGYQVRVTTHYEGREYEFTYAHLVDGSCPLQPGQAVKPGTPIGTGGGTGNIKGQHLHVSVKRRDATAKKETPYPFDLINPEPLFEEFADAFGIEVDWL